MHPQLRCPSGDSFLSAAEELALQRWENEGGALSHRDDAEPDATQSDNPSAGTNDEQHSADDLAA